MTVSLSPTIHLFRQEIAKRRGTDSRPSGYMVSSGAYRSLSVFSPGIYARTTLYVICGYHSFSFRSVPRTIPSKEPWCPTRKESAPWFSIKSTITVSKAPRTGEGVSLCPKKQQVIFHLLFTVQSSSTKAAMFRINGHQLQNVTYILNAIIQFALRFSRNICDKN